jgi:PA14 domain-containing protein
MSRITLLPVVLAAALATTIPAHAETISGLKPAEPQPTAQQLTPGLGVQYTYAIMNHVDEMKGRKFEPGPPITHLEWKMGEGTVLTSKSRQGVGAQITGFINFEKPGLYGVELTSNDGVRLEIGGKVIHEDPGVHSDTTTDRIDLQVDKPGWYPIQIVYFQKRYTATLVLRWAGPGEKKMVKLPEKVLAHTK